MPAPRKGRGNAGPKLKFANANKITDGLWIGGELDPTDRALAGIQLDELCEAGIDSIIDCRIESDDLDWVTQAKPQIDYLAIGVEDAGMRMPDDWFEDGTTYGVDQIAAGHVVLAHCQAGINRGPSMGFAILIALGWDALEALERIRTVRPIARIGYAEDAVDWWCRKVGLTDHERDNRVRQIRDWRAIVDLPRRSNPDAYGKPID